MPSAGDRLRRVALLAAAHQRRPCGRSRRRRARRTSGRARRPRSSARGGMVPPSTHVDALGAQRGDEAVVLGLHARDVGQLARLPEPVALGIDERLRRPRPSSRRARRSTRRPGRRTSTVRSGLTSSSQPQSGVPVAHLRGGRRRTAARDSPGRGSGPGARARAPRSQRHRRGAAGRRDGLDPLAGRRVPPTAAPPPAHLGQHHEQERRTRPDDAATAGC